MKVMMDLTQTSYDLSIPIEKPILVSKSKSLSPALVIFFWLTSTTIPLGLLLLYRAYAAKEGIILESGCHGPELPFGMLSGILMVLQLRFAV